MSPDKSIQHMIKHSHHLAPNHSSFSYTKGLPAKFSRITHATWATSRPIDDIKNLRFPSYISRSWKHSEAYKYECLYSHFKFLFFNYYFSGCVRWTYSWLRISFLAHVEHYNVDVSYCRPTSSFSYFGACKTQKCSAFIGYEIN